MRFVLAIYLLLTIFAAYPIGATSLVLPKPKEPSYDDILKSVVADPGNPKELIKTLWNLISYNPGASDANLRLNKEVEEWWLQYELERRGAIKWEKRLMPEIDRKLMDEIITGLGEKRLHDPCRQIDAILRQLEKVGSTEELPLLCLASQKARTYLGAWRFYATIQGILEREDIQKIVKTKDINIELLAPLLRDLSPEKSGLLALELFNQYAVKNDKDPWWIPPSLKCRLWLAWSISEVDPSKALEIFTAGLKCHDPALRLFSGMGILRISYSDVSPFSFTTPPNETEKIRSDWLRELKVRKPATFRFPAPLELPVIIKYPRGRVDLQWLNDTGKVIKEQVDVWPVVRYVLPDGTFYSQFTLGCGYLTALTNADGEMLVSFPEAKDWGNFWPSETGGFWGSAQPSASTCSSPASEDAGEYAPTGEMLWASSRRARCVFGAGRGKVLLVDGENIEIVNRRGDILWTITKGLDDARWAFMIDDETVLVTCTKDIQIHHKTKGILQTINGFVSPLWVRYHPENKWMFWDGGAQSIILYDQKSNKRVPTEIKYENYGRPFKSKWLPDGQRIPE